MIKMILLGTRFMQRRTSSMSRSISHMRSKGTIQNNNNETTLSKCDDNVAMSIESDMNSKETEDIISKSNLFSFLKMVKCERLTAEEKQIHHRHVEALKQGDETYTDPFSGYIVLSRLAHLRRGECCGNACRHCPYGQKGVPEDRPKKRYNSAFFI